MPELALQHAQAFNRGLLEAIPGGFVHVRSDGSIASANAEALRILGMSYDELTHRYTSDFETRRSGRTAAPARSRTTRWRARWRPAGRSRR